MSEFLVAGLSLLVGAALAVAIGVLPGVLLFRMSRRRGRTLASSGQSFVWGWILSWPGFAVERYRLSKRPNTPSPRLDTASKPKLNPWHMAAAWLLIGVSVTAALVSTGLSPSAVLALSAGVVPAAAAVLIGRTGSRWAPLWVVLVTLPALAGVLLLAGWALLDALTMGVAFALLLGGISWWLSAVQREQRRLSKPPV